MFWSVTETGENGKTGEMQNGRDEKRGAVDELDSGGRGWWMPVWPLPNPQIRQRVVIEKTRRHFNLLCGPDNVAPARSHPSFPGEDPISEAPPPGHGPRSFDEGESLNSMSPISDGFGHIRLRR